MRNNKQPLTQESMRAIVKEVTGYDSTNVKVSFIISNSNWILNVMVFKEHIPMC